MLQQRTIPAMISVKQINPAIPDLSKDHTMIDTVETAWDVEQDKRRLALLNNFGAAGSNAALILEESPAPEVDVTPASRGFVLGLSAKSSTALEDLRTSYLRALESPDVDDTFLADFAYTSTARRQQYDHRISVSGSSREEVVRNLRDAPTTRVIPSSSNAKTVFVFSGQGGQYVGMGSDLYKSSPLFADLVDECHEKLLSWGYPGIIEVFDPSQSTDGSCAKNMEVMQPAVFVLEYALAKLWMSWGLVPDAVVGHRYVPHVLLSRRLLMTLLLAVLENTLPW